MKYLKSAQVVPGKGTAWMLYEVEGNDTIVRMLTHIPEVGEIKLYPQPRVKTLFRPELLAEASREEFEYLWETAAGSTQS